MCSLRFPVLKWVQRLWTREGRTLSFFCLQDGDNQGQVDKAAVPETPWNELTHQERLFYEESYRRQGQIAADLAEPLSVREVYALDLLGAGEQSLVLEVGSGSGRHAVEIARRGAIVVAVDVSVAGVQRGQALAQMAGQSSHVHAASMDAHALGLADASVDLVFGAQVLHHLDCAQAGAEIGRVLRPGGRAVFIENSARNPLLMWARRHLVGRIGIRRYGSAAEAPLDDAEIRIFCRQFGGSVRVHFPQLCLTVLLARHWLNFPWAVQFFLQIDQWLERWIPALRSWSFLQVLEFVKAPQQPPPGDR